MGMPPGTNRGPSPEQIPRMFQPSGNLSTSKFTASWQDQDSQVARRGDDQNHALPDDGLQAHGTGVGARPRPSFTEEGVGLVRVSVQVDDPETQLRATLEMERACVELMLAHLPEDNPEQEDDMC